MKQYVIDELRPEDYSKIKDYLNNNFLKSDVGELYWIELECDILSSTQKQHYDKCAPFYLALNLENDKLCCELLVRTLNSTQCQCIANSNIEQINWIINLIDVMIFELGIIA